MDDQLYTKVNCKDELPQDLGKFDTDKGTLYFSPEWDGETNQWSCQEHFLSEERPNWWLKPFNEYVPLNVEKRIPALCDKLDVLKEQGLWEIFVNQNIPEINRLRQILFPDETAPEITFEELVNLKRFVGEHQIRIWLLQYYKAEMSLSKFVELINVKANRYFSPQEIIKSVFEEFPQNRPLYKDSGLWQLRTDDMENVIVNQGVNEKDSDFFLRCKRELLETSQKDINVDDLM